MNVVAKLFDILAIGGYKQAYLILKGGRPGIATAFKNVFGFIASKMVDGWEDLKVTTIFGSIIGAGVYGGFAIAVLPVLVIGSIVGIPVFVASIVGIIQGVNAQDYAVIGPMGLVAAMSWVAYSLFPVALAKILVGAKV